MAVPIMLANSTRALPLAGGARAEMMAWGIGIPVGQGVAEQQALYGDNEAGTAEKQESRTVSVWVLSGGGVTGVVWLLIDVAWGCDANALNLRPNRLLKNVGEAADARREWPKKRSLPVVNEHFEAILNAADATQVVFQQPANMRPSPLGGS
ncbi:MAG: hypothetical protein AB7Q00_16150 [Phycisphaerales bacterium]